MQKEIWKDIDGYEGIYQISNYGDARSIDRLDFSGHSRKGKLLEKKINELGYARYGLYKNGKQKFYFAHRLVAEMFISNLNNYPIVNHKDENSSNNNVNNLEWCTQKYNRNYGNCNEKVAIAESTKVYQYDLKGNIIKMWDSTREAGRNGFIQGHISRCCNKKRKTHKGYIWSYTPLP